MASDAEKRGQEILAAARKSMEARSNAVGASERGAIELKAKLLKTGYAVLQDMFTAAQYHVQTIQEPVTLHRNVTNPDGSVSEISYVINVNDNITRLVMDVLQSQITEDGGAIWRKVQDTLPSAPTFTNSKVAGDRLASSLQGIEMLLGNYTGIAGITIGNDRFTMDKEGRAAIKQHIANAPERVANEVINRAVIQGVVQNMGGNAPLIIASINLASEAMHRSYLRNDDYAVKQWAYMMQVFNEHITNIRDFTGASKDQRGALQLLLGYLPKAATLTTSKAVGENQLVRSSTDGRLVARIRLLCSTQIAKDEAERIAAEKAREADAALEPDIIIANTNPTSDRQQPSIAESDQENPGLRVLQELATREWGDVKVMGELHAYMLNQRLLEKQGRHFSSDKALDGTDEDVRLVLMKMSEVQQRAATAKIEDRPDVLWGNKDVVLAAYLKPLFGGAQEQLELDGETIKDPAKLREWIMGNAQVYLVSGVINPALNETNLDVLWKIYLDASQQRPEANKPHRERTFIITDRSRVMAVSDGPEAPNHVRLLDPQSVIHDPAVVMAAPASKVDAASASHGQGVAGGGDKSAGNYTATIVRGTAALSDDPFSRG